MAPSYNPVAASTDKPAANREDAHWLEVHEAALYREAAGTYKPPKDKEYCATPFTYPLIATYP